MTETHDAGQTRASHDERLDLPIEQAVLLWCIRLSVMGMKQGAAVQPRIDEMLEALDASTAAPWLKDFMVALSQGCTRMIEVTCVCQPRIGPDERALLDILSLAQAMRPFEALLLLRGFVTQAAAIEALRSAEGVGVALALAGRFLPEPEQEMRHFAMTQAAPAALAGRQTLH